MIIGGALGGLLGIVTDMVLALLLIVVKAQIRQRYGNAPV